MKYNLLLVALASCLFSGCTKQKQDDRVTQTRLERDERLNSYVRVDDELDRTSWKWLEKQAYEIIDLKYDLDAAELRAAVKKKIAEEKASQDGLTDQESEDIVDSMEKRLNDFVKAKDSKKTEVRTALRRLEETKRTNKINLAVASDLDMLLQRFNESGVDLPQAALQSINVLKEILEMQSLRKSSESKDLPNLTKPTNP